MLKENNFMFSTNDPRINNYLAGVPFGFIDTTLIYQHLQRILTSHILPGNSSILSLHFTQVIFHLTDYISFYGKGVLNNQTQLFHYICAYSYVLG